MLSAITPRGTYLIRKNPPQLAKFGSPYDMEWFRPGSDAMVLRVGVGSIAEAKQLAAKHYRTRAPASIREAKYWMRAPGGR